MEKKQLTFTLISHHIRKYLNLDLIEYCIADMIYHLSNNPNSKIQGWCYASKKYMADVLGVSSQTIFSNLIKLIEKGIVEKDEDTKYIRTTSIWYENVILIKTKKEYKETLQGIKKLDSSIKKLDTKYKESLDEPIKKLDSIYINNNNRDNNKYNTSIKEKKHTDKDVELTKFLYSKVNDNFPFLLERKTEKMWIKDYNEMNKIYRIDGRNYKTIEFIINWCQEDDFWKQNIRSVSKLRKQFDSLMVKAKSQFDKPLIQKI